MKFPTPLFEAEGIGGGGGTDEGVSVRPVAARLPKNGMLKLEQRLLRN